MMHSLPWSARGSLVATLIALQLSFFLGGCGAKEAGKSSLDSLGSVAERGAEHLLRFGDALVQSSHSPRSRAVIETADAGWVILGVRVTPTSPNVGHPFTAEVAYAPEPPRILPGAPTLRVQLVREDVVLIEQTIQGEAALRSLKATFKVPPGAIAGAYEVRALIGENKRTTKKRALIIQAAR